MLLLVFVVFLLVVAYFINRELGRKKDAKYFKDRGVTFQPTDFILVRLKDMATNNIVDLLEKFYKKYENERIVGFFNGSTPNYFLRDPQLVKQIGVKDFDHFVDHANMIDTDYDRFFGNTLISLTGKRWRDMRSSLSPAFTGSKMRLMFQLVQQCSEQMSNFFLEESKIKGPQVHDMKAIYSKFTNDVIATCAFGVKCDTFREPNNEFFTIGQKIANFQSPWTMFKLVIYRMIRWPALAKLFDIKVLDSHSQSVFTDIITTTMQFREEKNIVRPDMVNLLMEMKKGQLESTNEKDIKESIAAVEDYLQSSGESKSSWTDEQLIPQCFIFFLAGFDTSSTLMTFVAYELAVNPDVQHKLLQEVDQTKEELAGKPLDYDHLQAMTYLDLVIAETLRKWPPAPLIDRLCVKDYKYQSEDGFQMVIDKGADVLVPIYALHRDPEYFPDPEKFIPDRFSAENKSSINLNAYLPFGIGPRNCIGSRFALMETKSVIYHLLLNFTFNVGEKTQVPVQLKKTMAGLIPEKIELLLKPRSGC